MMGIGPFLASIVIIMLSRREVLIELKRIGTHKPSHLKASLRDFEKYMIENYGLKLEKKKKRRMV